MTLYVTWQAVKYLNENIYTENNYVLFHTIFFIYPRIEIYETRIVGNVCELIHLIFIVYWSAYEQFFFNFTFFGFIMASLIWFIRTLFHLEPDFKENWIRCFVVHARRKKLKDNKECGVGKQSQIYFS